MQVCEGVGCAERVLRQRVACLISCTGTTISPVSTTHLLNDKHIVAAVPVLDAVLQEKPKVVLVRRVGGGVDVHDEGVCWLGGMRGLVQVQQRGEVWSTDAMRGVGGVERLVTVFGLHGGELGRQTREGFVGAVHCGLFKVLTASPGCWHLGAVPDGDGACVHRYAAKPARGCQRRFHDTLLRACMVQGVAA